MKIIHSIKIYYNTILLIIYILYVYKLTKIEEYIRTFKESYVQMYI